LGIAIIAGIFAVFIARVLLRNPDTLAAFFRRPQTFPLLLLLVAVLVVLLLWKVPQWQVARSRALTDDNRFDRENEARKTLAQIIGGVFVLAGLYSSVQTFDLAREGQITDRYTRAIDQLGAIESQASKDGEALPRSEMRLGGIYALERIAHDSERDRGPILDVLTAYVRTNSNQESLLPKVGLRQDIQAILDVVARPREGRYIFEPFKIDLSEAKLGLANLSEAKLHRADLILADLRANPGGADLSGADLSGANLREANLRGGGSQRGEPQGGGSQRREPPRGGPPRGANLTPDQIKNAHFDEQTKLPWPKK
jgi:hypothetical protein